MSPLRSPVAISFEKAAAFSCVGLISSVAELVVIVPDKVAEPEKTQTAPLFVVRVPTSGVAVNPPDTISSKPSLSTSPVATSEPNLSPNRGVAR